MYSEFNLFYFYHQDRNTSIVYLYGNLPIRSAIMILSAYSGDKLSDKVVTFEK